MAREREGSFMSNKLRKEESVGELLREHTITLKNTNSLTIPKQQPYGVTHLIEPIENRSPSRITYQLGADATETPKLYSPLTNSHTDKSAKKTKNKSPKKILKKLNPSTH